MGAAILNSFRKSNIANILLRTFQLIVGLVIIGLYGVDLNRARREDKYTDGKWVFAVVCGTLSAVTAITDGLVGVFLSYRSVALTFAWDFVLMILFTALSGIFGTMFVGEKTEMEWGIHRMKVAVGFDLAGLVLWFATGVLGLWWTLAERRGAGRVAAGRGKA